jgi:cell division transport system permease protein
MNRLHRYAISHAQNLVAALGRLVRQPMSSMLTVAVIGIALALPAGLRVLVNNAGNLSGSWESAVDFTVYLELTVDEQRARQLAQEIQAREDVASVALISRSEALEEFRAYSGFGDALQALEENPLPHALVVRPSSDGDSETDISTLAAQLEDLGETAFVQLDTAWVERFRAILDIAGRSVDMATVLLALAVIIVIGNTIRLEINNRRQEIEVMKLVGGSDGFVRRPFLYLGLWYGLAGGVLAWLVLLLGLTLLAGPVANLAGLYRSSFVLRSLGAGEVLALVASGAILGWLGAGLATARHLRAIQPS